MKVTKKLRNHILNIVAEISREKLDEHCPGVTGNNYKDTDHAGKERRELIIDVTNAIERRLSGKLSALITG